jgi:hypothetical protein
MQKKKDQSEFSSNWIFFIRIIIQMKIAKFGYLKKKISRSIQINPDSRYRLKHYLSDLKLENLIR